MARDIHNGYQVPTKTDDGDEWGEIVETFMERMANHSHSGTDSNELTTKITKNTQTFLATEWQADSRVNKEGFEMTVSCYPTTDIDSGHKRDFYLVDDNSIERILIIPTIVWSGSVGQPKDQMTVYTNRDDLNLRVVTY